MQEIVLFRCIDNQISLPMVIGYIEIYLLFFTGRWAYNMGAWVEGRGGGALKVFPSTSTLRFFKYVIEMPKGHDHGLFKF